MITRENAVVRIADADDSAVLALLFNGEIPRSFCLNFRRELQHLTADELREALSQKELAAGMFYTIEDKIGGIRGFFSLKTPQQGANFSEFLFGLINPEDYDSALARDAMQVLELLAFVEKRLNKLVAQCLENETDYRSLLVSRGFKSDGVQRDVLYTGGRYLDLETLTLFREDFFSAGSVHVAQGTNVTMDER